ncbi:TIGR00730 family Rossman fold protein [Legionella shakespearei]|uniref:Cytokinin riboside 5'-monophosphate phosphoribohydrolase n=1 Tax=Legionella shakespearei DSM 23087 TaxID=1122169 RepID=A0A0W0YQC6_9GAMM|nr:TIGR00730 family Rossman fold protein [Legionella shakespearei]KTD59088.1 lysine decarboxylase [Legionella shakespearei DSM 23087]
MSETTYICVFLGAKEGKSPVYRSNARLLGLELAKQNCTLVYGGARNGLMGVLADAVLDAGGKAIGVMPTSLASELHHDQLTKLHVVESMQDRKALMSELADAFVFFPGGLGTFEELFEVWSAKKIGIHDKPLGFLNINGYYNHLFHFLRTCSEEHFITENQLQQVSIMDNPAELIKHTKEQIQQGVCEAIT